MTKQIILASVSPRRKQLMMHLGVPFKVEASNYHEVHHKHLKPEALVRFLAEGKALAVAKHHKNSLIVGGDTVVVFRGKVFGKPKDKAEARQMLKTFSGRVIYAYTGISVVDSDTEKKLSACVKTKVIMRDLNENQIDYYISTGEPMDKAGAFGPLGAGKGLIKKLEGDFTGAFGLPLDELVKMLKKFGVKIK